MPTLTCPEYLLSPCSSDVCRLRLCPEAIKQAPSGRFYITMGHAGFNSPANNFDGYATRENALRSLRFYLGR